MHFQISKNYHKSVPGVLFTWVRFCRTPRLFPNSSPRSLSWLTVEGSPELAISSEGRPCRRRLRGGGARPNPGAPVGGRSSHRGGSMRASRVCQQWQLGKHRRRRHMTVMEAEEEGRLARGGSRSAKASAWRTRGHSPQQVAGERLSTSVAVF
jgi:hypothetical protein